MFVALAGFAAGLVHVLSGPDHLAAVAPLAAGQANGQWRTGLRWGLGHTAGVLLIGLLMIALRGLLPIDALSAYSERVIGVVLLGVGGWAFMRARSPRPHQHVNTGRVVRGRRSSRICGQLASLWCAAGAGAPDQPGSDGVSLRLRHRGGRRHECVRRARRGGLARRRAPRCQRLPWNALRVFRVGNRGRQRLAGGLRSDACAHPRYRRGDPRDGRRLRAGRPHRAGDSLRAGPERQQSGLRRPRCDHPWPAAAQSAAASSDAHARPEVLRHDRAAARHHPGRHSPERVRRAAAGRRRTAGGDRGDRDRIWSS